MQFPELQAEAQSICMLFPELQAEARSICMRYPELRAAAADDALHFCPNHGWVPTTVGLGVGFPAKRRKSEPNRFETQDMSVTIVKDQCITIGPDQHFAIGH